MNGRPSGPRSLRCALGLHLWADCWEYDSSYPGVPFDYSPVMKKVGESRVCLRCARLVVKHGRRGSYRVEV